MMCSLCLYVHRPARILLASLLAGLTLLASLPSPAMAQVETKPRIYSPTDLTAPPSTPNPYVSLFPVEELEKVDWNYWRQKMQFESQRRWERIRGPQNQMAVPYAELEPVGTLGDNDILASAEAITGVGTGPGDDPDLTISGDLAGPVTPSPGSATEDDGSITGANDTGLTPGTAVTIDATIGDGPHGSGGSGSGDFDHYLVTATAAGQSILVDTDTPTGPLDTVVGIYDAVTGELLASNDDSDASFDSFLDFLAPAAGTYSVMVRGFGTGFQPDPFDSSSGSGAGSEGPYTVLIGLNAADVDVYGLDLAAGDVVAASVSGAALNVAFLAPDGSSLMGSGQDFSAIYAVGSPLVGGGNGVLAAIAPTTGTYGLRISVGSGAYTVTTQVLRPGLEQALGKQQAADKQTIFLDFDGATIDAASLFGGNNPATLSPLSSFLAGWGLAPGDESAVIDAVIASMQETLLQDFVGGPNPFFNAEILNSRDHPDPFGGPNVSRVIIGGTVSQLGITTLGIAESIDPGNYGTEETAVVLLDLLSEVASNPNSLNQFDLAGGATIIDLIGTGVGNIAAHEAGHILGSFHTDQFNGDSNIMDQGGNLANTIGVGPNGDFETPVGSFYAAAKLMAGDDVDVDFIRDTFVPNEGYTGREDTRALTAFALYSPVLLPVELVAFEAHTEESALVLTWHTTSETNNAGFEVEMRNSECGVSCSSFRNPNSEIRNAEWQSAGWVEGHGTTTEPHTYTYRLSDLEPGRYRFRLKQIDFDGTETFSPEIEAVLGQPGAFLLTDAYPNPFNPEAIFTLAVNKPQYVRVDLYDPTGRLVRTLHEGPVAADTIHRFTIDGGSLSSGLYLYRVSGEHFAAETRRVVLLK